MIRRVIAGTACIVIAVLTVTAVVKGYDEYAECLEVAQAASCDAHPPAGPKCPNPLDDDCGQTECYFCNTPTSTSARQYCILVPFKSSSCPGPHGTLTCSPKKRKTPCREHLAKCTCRNEGGEVVTETCFIKTCLRQH